MTPKERVVAALSCEWADRVPFTSYYNKFFYSRTERELRNDGLCIIHFRVPVFRCETQEVREQEIVRQDVQGRRLVTRIIETPKGKLSETFVCLPDHPLIPYQLLPWRREYLFKGPEDYPVLEYMIRNRRYVPQYESFSRLQEDVGDDVFLIPTVGYSPLMTIIYEIMGLERFSVEWNERRASVMELFEVLTEDQRRYFPIIAGSPAKAVIFGGNVSTEVIGLDRFESYILPHYNALATQLHKRGKLLGVHFDANTRAFAPSIAESEIDFIEAFTPSPDTDMGVREARSYWKDKVLWINFPSSVHLKSPQIVEETARKILQEADSGKGFLIGITETVPPERWQSSFSVISRVVREEGRLPLGKSR